MKPELSVLIVHYRAEHLLPPLFDSMGRFLSSRRSEILVWDNGSQDGKPDGLTSSVPIGWHRSPQNVGFARGHLALAKRARGDWCLILNPDAAFAEGGLERLWQTAGERPRAGVVAPRIAHPDAKTQPTLFPPYSFWFDLKKSFWLEHQLWAFPALKKLWTKLERAKEPFPVGWASGACLLVRREAWEKTGGFDPNFFFGGEDADFCRRVWEAGFEVLCEPRARLLHQGGQSLRKEFENRIFYYYQKRLYFAKKNFARWQYAVLFLISFFELVLKWAVGTLLGIYKPEWRRRRRGYGRTLAFLLSARFRRPEEWLKEGWGKQEAEVEAAV